MPLFVFTHHHPNTGPVSINAECQQPRAKVAIPGTAERALSEQKEGRIGAE